MGVAEARHLQGAKIAVICNSAVVAYLRDDFDHIPNPNQWDLPGGVREGSETAFECAIRETHEEFGISLSKNLIDFETTYFAEAAGALPKREVAFFACVVSEELISTIKFGEEGQCWRMMPIQEFVTRSDVVPELQIAFRVYWESCT